MKKLLVLPVLLGALTFVGSASATTTCFNSPGSCGYPDPNYGWVSTDNAWSPGGGGGVGPETGNVAEACSSLTSSGSITSTLSGQFIADENITGTINVTTNNVTITNDCVTTTGNGSLGTFAIKTNGHTGIVIKNTTVAGASGSPIESGLNGQATMLHDYFYNESDPIEYNNLPVKYSYLISNGTLTSAHYEDIYGNNQTIDMVGDTLFNPNGQTATVFDDTNLGSGGSCSNSVTITGSLLAGGGFTIYPCANASSVGTSTADVENNKFVRCTTTPVEGGGGNWTCTSGEDDYGYFPFSGDFGPSAYSYFGDTGWTESNNTWLDDGSSVSL